MLQTCKMPQLKRKTLFREEMLSVASVLGVQHLVSRLTNVLRSRVSSMWWQRMVGSTLLRAAAPVPCRE